MRLPTIDDMKQPRVRWFHLTPGHFVLALLAVECRLWLSDRFGWLGWHKGYAVLTGVAVVSLAVLGMFAWFGVALIFRRRFQFSIRSLLLLVVVVALPCSWLAVKMKTAMQQRETIKWVRQSGGTAYCTWQLDATFLPVRTPRPPGPACVRNLLPDDFFADIVKVTLDHTTVTDEELIRFDGLRLNRLLILSLENTQVTNVGMENLKPINQLQALDLDGTQITDTWLKHLKGAGQLRTLCVGFNQRITDVGLKYLEGLVQLKQLILSGTQVTDAGLEQLSGMVQLEDLSISDTNITDGGLEHLAGFVTLRTLVLDDCRVTDAGLRYLRGLTSLEGLWLHGTQVTDAGVAKLQQALPNCKITR